MPSRNPDIPVPSPDLPSADAATRRVLSAVAAALPFAPPARLLTALSGGADSVALLLALRALGYDVEAAHCNFRLRGAESDRDERFVVALCRRLGVKLHLTAFDTAASAARAGESIEMAARRLRYAWFYRLLDATGCRAVAVAHHVGDDVETLLLNLLRGTGIRGLTGMEMHGGRVVRPLLRLTRGDIERFLEAARQDFVTDSTNRETRFRRNKIRLEVLPLLRSLNPSADRALLTAMHHLEGSAALADYAARTIAATAVRRLSDGVRIDTEALLALPLPDSGREALLHEWMGPFGFPPQTVADVVRDLRGQPGACYEAADYLAVRDRGFLEVRRRPVRFSACPLPEEGTLRLPSGLRLRLRRLPRREQDAIPRERRTACLDADTLCGPLTCRSTETADRFRPFGMKGTKLVSDLLTDRKRTRIDKLAATVVCDAQGIVWLTGERPAARCAVTPQTTRLLLITEEE